MISMPILTGITFEPRAGPAGALIDCGQKRYFGCEISRIARLLSAHKVSNDADDLS
jgi:hypothetical protein